MVRDYIFAYNGDMADVIDPVEPGEMTYHEHLLQQDGHHCKADPDEAVDGIVEAYFDDGNELNVYLFELTEIKE